MRSTIVLFLLLALSIYSSDIDDRVEAILKKMNLQEKVAQTFHVWYPEKPDEIIEKYKNTGVGAVYIFSMGNDRDRVQKSIISSSRLHIPVSFVAEGLHGASINCTIFPMPVGMSTTWNAELVEEVHRVIALESRAVGADRTFSPNMNLYTDPRFGRFQEGFGEDPHLQAVMSVSSVVGLQGLIKNDYLNQSHITAVAKHFIAYGHNAAGQDGSPTDMSERTFRDIYLYAWKKVVNANTRSIMASHQEFNGVPCHGNSYLLRDVLRKELNWTGIINSDAGDVGGLASYSIVADREDAAVLAMNSGVDIDLAIGAYNNLESAIKKGKLSIQTLDETVRRILRGKFEAGLFDNPMIDQSKKKYINSKEHRALSLKTAHQSIVMLKNNNTLPLSEAIKSIAVIGPNANSTENQLGGYTWGGANVVTVLGALSKYNIKYSLGCQINNKDQKDIVAAVEIARASDVAILVLGDSVDSCGESFGGVGDRSILDLSGSQIELVKAVKATGKPVIVVLINGRPQTFGPDNEVLSYIDALLVAWRPGEEGGTAISDVLFGKVSPSGKLSSTWVRSSGHIRGPSQPYYQKRRQYDGRGFTFENSSPLFPFGFGLSYTTFKYDNLAINPNKIVGAASATISISLTVTNTGQWPGREIVQVYVTEPTPTSVVRYTKLLKAFNSVELLAGKSGIVKLEVAVQDLMYHDLDMKHRLHPGIYKIEVASSSDDKNSLKGQFEITS